jgi:hypothetical protein
MRGAPPMRRVLRSVVGVPVKLLAVFRAPPEPPPLDLIVWDRGDVMKFSLPSRKNKRFSGKKVSLDVKLTTTSSDSTDPKSGYSAAVNWRSLVGR